MVVEAAPRVNPTAAHCVLEVTDIVIRTVPLKVVDAVRLGKEPASPKVELAGEREVRAVAVPLALSPSVGGSNDVVQSSVGILESSAESSCWRVEGFHQ